MRFADILVDNVPILEKDRTFRGIDTEDKENKGGYVNRQDISFFVQFEDVDEFLEELKLQFYNAHLPDCELYVSWITPQLI